MRPPPGHVEPSEVSDEAFANAVHTLLRDGTPTKQRQALLEGVVRRQLAHSAERLKAKQRERGVSSVFGAIYLVRVGELRPEMIDQTGDQALAQAVDAIAATGDEGRSIALYDLRKFALPPNSPARADVDEHLAAIQRWIDETEKPGDMKPTELAGKREKRLVARALLLPTDDAQKDASNAVVQWVDAGIAFQTRYQSGRQEGGFLERPSREEVVEGFRALSSGAATLAATYLRSGDAAGAADALKRTSVSQVTPPGLQQRLDAAVSPGDAAAWKAMLQLFTRRDEHDDETAIDRSLVQAATFGIAIEAYRRDPTSAEVGVQLASALTAYGIAEAAPEVLADSAEKHADPTIVSAMLEAVARSMLREEQEDDPSSARRVFAASERLLAVAERPELRGKITPSPARFRLLAAGIDARAGELASAKALLDSSVKEEPSADGLRLLADVDRQMGKPQEALQALAQVVASPEAKRDRLLEADARLAASDIQRELGARDKAREELLGAFRAATDARKMATQAAAVARSERTLAKIWDRLGDDAAAAHATERAITAAKNDPRQLGVSILDALARAYVARDVQAARHAARAAVGAGLPDEETVYIGIWLQFLERETNSQPDGTAAKLLDEVDRNASWTGRLASWALGKTSDAELVAAARTPAQKTEAAFYRALAERAAGRTQAAETQLREVARSATLELMEAQIARDLLAGADRRLPGPTPTP